MVLDKERNSAYSALPLMEGNEMPEENALWTRLYHEHDDQAIYRAGAGSRLRIPRRSGGSSSLPDPRIADRAGSTRRSAAHGTHCGERRPGCFAHCWFASDDRNQWRRILRLRQRRPLASGAGGAAAGRCLGSERRAASHVADRSETGSDLRDLAGRPVRFAGGGGDGAAQRDVAGDALRLAGGA